MSFDIEAYRKIKRHIGTLTPPMRHINIVAATKQQPSETIIEAIQAGLTHFGENRLQEAKTKWPEIKAANSDITLQMIGGLQTNKVDEAVALFDEIITLDRESLAKALRKAMDKQGKEIPLMIQINTGEEKQKSGIAPTKADEFIEYCQNELALPIVGLMCVPPQGQYPAPHFALLATIAKRHGLKRLSMGMSSDYETAIRMGATEIRLGTVLFGSRDNV